MSNEEKLKVLQDNPNAVFQDTTLEANWTKVQGSEDYQTLLEARSMAEDNNGLLGSVQDTVEGVVEGVGDVVKPVGNLLFGKEISPEELEEFKSAVDSNYIKPNDENSVAFKEMDVDEKLEWIKNNPDKLSEDTYNNPIYQNFTSKGIIDQGTDLIGNVTEGVGSAGKGVGSIVENMGSLGSNIVKGVDTVADGFGLGAPVAAGVAAGLYGAKKLGLDKLVGKQFKSKSAAEKREEIKNKQDLIDVDEVAKDQGFEKRSSINPYRIKYGNYYKKKDKKKGGGKTKTKKLSRKKLKKQINRLQSSLKKLQKTRKKHIQLFF